jgi:subtilisin family serine protease
MDVHKAVVYSHSMLRSRAFRLLLLLWSFSLLVGNAAASHAQASSTPSHLEGALARLLDLDESAALVWAQEQGITLDPSRRAIRVVMEPEKAQPTRIQLERLRALGATIEAKSEHLLRAWLPLKHLGEIARFPGIAWIRRPYTMQPLAVPYTTGALATGATLFHSYGFRGQGISIAVIDAGFLGLDEAIGNGWISRRSVMEKIDYTGEGFEGDSDHGTQIARIVYEMAPEASLWLMRIGDEVDLENAVQDAIRARVRLISHSLGWFDSNFGDGKGLINEIAQQALDAGILWVNAAGNHAERHWLGLFRDENGDGWAEFGHERDSLAVWAGFGGVIELVLVWDDWPLTDQDYDLFLLNRKGEVVASSADVQRGDEPPRESLKYVVEEPGVYQLKVRSRRSTRPMKLRIFSLGHDITPATPYESIVAPADCTCVVAVGAVSLYGWEEGVVESFSALGPTTDGRIKPDIVGPDRVRDFWGTSAAAPYVAGAAALLLSQHPDWSADELRDGLLNDAQDLGPAGMDVVSGAGRLQLLLGHPKALRSLSTGQVVAGGSLTVRISIRMPAALFGSVTLSEKFPAGFSLETVKDGDAPAITNGARWAWPMLTPGESPEVIYRLVVSVDVPPGRYRIEGTLNDRPVEGDQWLEVLPPEPSSLHPMISFQWSRREIVFQREKASGMGVGDWQVRVFDLMGRERFDSGFVQGWQLSVSVGRSWANGVYLTVITVRDSSGHVLHREIRRLVILR